MTFYSAMIKTRADDGVAVAEGALDLFLNAVQPFGGAVRCGGDPQGWSARISIEARDAADAVAVAAALVTRLAADVGLPGWPVVRAEAVREDVFDENPRRAAVAAGSAEACWRNPPLRSVHGRPTYHGHPPGNEIRVEDRAEAQKGTGRGTSPR